MPDNRLGRRQRHVRSMQALRVAVLAAAPQAAEALPLLARGRREHADLGTLQKLAAARRLQQLPVALSPQPWAVGGGMATSLEGGPLANRDVTFDAVRRLLLQNRGALASEDAGFSAAGPVLQGIGVPPRFAAGAGSTNVQGLPGLLAPMLVPRPAFPQAPFAAGPFPPSDAATKPGGSVSAANGAKAPAASWLASMVDKADDFVATYSPGSAEVSLMKQPLLRVVLTWLAVFLSVGCMAIFRFSPCSVRGCCRCMRKGDTCSSKHAGLEPLPKQASQSSQLPKALASRPSLEAAAPVGEGTCFAGAVEEAWLRLPGDRTALQPPAAATPVTARRSLPSYAPEDLGFIVDEDDDDDDDDDDACVDAFYNK